MHSVAIALALSIVVMSQLSPAQGTPEITPQMTATETRLLAKLNPAQIDWIKQEAARQLSGTGEPGQISPESMKTFSVLGPMNNQDIEAIAFLVLMQAAKSAQEDLKSVMGQVKAINAAKASVRETQRATAVAGSKTSARIEAPVDRRAKLLETASSLMKKMAADGSTTVQK